MTLTEIGQAIRDARKQHGHTLQTVAAALGMGIATLSRLERGELDDIGTRRLMRVADYLGLQLVLRPASHGMTLEEAMQDAASDFAAPTVRAP